MSRADGDFTPTQKRILTVLADGYRHSREELRRCIDEYSELTTLRMHLSYLRTKLHRRGEDIICELYQRGIHYRHVRLLVPAGDGCR